MIELSKQQEVVIPIGRKWPDRCDSTTLAELYSGVKLQLRYVEYKDKHGTAMVPVIEEIQDDSKRNS